MADIGPLGRPLVAADSHPSTCCRSSVVEHSIGNGEVDSSILSGSTIQPADIIAFYLIDCVTPFASIPKGTTAEPPREIEVYSAHRQDLPSHPE